MNFAGWSPRRRRPSRELERALNKADAELVALERLLEEAKEAEQGCQRRIPG